MKIDTHVHCTLEKTPIGFGTPNLPESRYIADPVELMTHLRKQGTGRAILMSNGDQDSPVEGGSHNKACWQIAAQYPDFYSWMCCFQEADTSSVYERMATCKEQGAVGVGELSINQWISHSSIQEIFRCAELLELPVVFHMSPEPGFQYGICDRPGLPLLEKALIQYPRLKFIGHSQPFWMELSGHVPTATRERSGIGEGPIQPGGRVPALMEAYPNLYADLSAYSGNCAILRDEEFGLDFLERFRDRLLFATDSLNRYSLFPLGKFLDDSLANGRLSRQAYHNICYENAQELFHLPPLCL